MDRFEVKTIQNVQNIQHNTKQQNGSNYNVLQRFDVKTIKTFELGGKTTKVIKLQWIETIWHLNDENFRVTSQNYKSHQITMNCIDLTSKRSKMLSYKTFNTTQNNKSDQITTNCIDLMSKKSKERKTTKLRRKTFQTTQNYESDHIIIIASIWRQNHQNFWVRWQNYKSNQITMNCIDLMSKRSKMLSYVAQHSKQRKTTKLIKL